MAESKDQNGKTTASSSSSAGKPQASDTTDIDLIKSQLDRVREDLAQLGDMVGMTARERFNQAKTQVTAGAEGAKEQAVDQFTAAVNDVEANVRRNPLTALAIVLGIGYIFGAFSRK